MRTLLRELQRAFEQAQQAWAKKVQELRLDIHDAVESAGGFLSPEHAEIQRQSYRGVLAQAQRECLSPDESQRTGRRGRLKRSKSRNLLERLRNYAADVLRFLDNRIVPFTNKPEQHELREPLLQQKFTACFRSLAGAKIFCRLHSYLSTCRKITVLQARL